MEPLNPWRKRLLGVAIVLAAVLIVVIGAIRFILFPARPGLTAARPLSAGKVVPQIAIGNGRAFLIAPDGSLWRWGMDNTIPSDGGAFNVLPVRFGNDSDWCKIAAGSTHTLAIKTDGTLWGWGWNTHGALGLPNNVAVVRRPQRLDPDTNWVQINASSMFTLALKADGSLWSCGQNASGQMGDGSTQDRFGLQEVTPEHDWKMTATGLGNSFGIKTNGTLWVWGSDPLPAAEDYVVPTRIGTETNWSYVAASNFEVFALRSDGTLWIGGHNARFTAPADVPGPARGMFQIGADSDWKEIQAGHGYYFARKMDSSWWIGGGNTWGQLGIGGAQGIIKREKLDKPEKLPFEMEPWALTLAPDYPSTHVLTRGGVLWSWGTRLGIPTPDPKYRPLKLRFNNFLYQFSGRRISGFSMQEEAIDATPRRLWEFPEGIVVTLGSAEQSGISKDPR